MVALKLKPTLELTDAVFEQLCRQNPDLRLERTAQGELIAMAPASSETGYYNADLLGQLWQWNRQKQLGIVLDSSAGFTLPNGAIRSPDAAWISLPRWHALTPEQRRRFAPLCPDFVLELKSPSDDLSTLQAKLQEYMENGAQLGWLVDPETCQVYCYRPGQTVQACDRPDTLAGDPVLPNFTMDFTLIWSSQ
ncbi:Uma2 family endonuclease [Gloeomargaritales cyanobacterium VI4D9]|nr:Uma2 family endonuclease [Gloeomargaritales cyanobacterium VI4D9]